MKASAASTGDSSRAAREQVAPEALCDQLACDELVRRYHEQGFGLVRGVFSVDEITALAADAKRLLERRDLIETNNLRCRWQTDVTTGACVFDAFDPVMDISSACAAIASDRRLRQLVERLYGEPGHLFKDKLIFKPPGANGYGLHQDFIAWPTFPRSFLTVLVAIDEADAASGCIEVFPGVRECLTPQNGLYHEIPPETIDETEGVKLRLEPGDVAFFSALTPHRSAPNRSRRWRRQLYLSYNADSDGGDRRAAHYVEFQAWLRERYAEFGRNEVYFA